jgi:hypothetical protein
MRRLASNSSRDRSWAFTPGTSSTQADPPISVPLDNRSSAIAFHVETFGGESLAPAEDGPVLEALYVAEGSLWV